MNTPSPPTRAPTAAPTASPVPPNGSPCNCDSCTSTVLDTLASGFSCGDRIQDVINVNGLSELNACRLVADEFPATCGPDCHPDKVRKVA